MNFLLGYGHSDTMFAHPTDFRQLWRNMPPDFRSEVSARPSTSRSGPLTHTAQSQLRAHARGDPLSSALLHTAQNALNNPFVGALLGLLLAAGLMLVSRASFKRITAENAPAGMAFAALSLFARLAFVTAALWAYKHFFNSGFKPFALCLAGGFLVLYTVEVVRYSGLLKRQHPSGAR